jgi:hypothetical protein
VGTDLSQPDAARIWNPCEPTVLTGATYDIDGGEQAIPG